MTDENYYRRRMITLFSFTKSYFTQCNRFILNVHMAIKSTSLDTSAGPDGVLIRTMRALDVAYIIRTIIEILLKTSYVPKSLRQARTILVYKGKGSATDISSWRPVSIFSFIRRIIEKVLDAELRSQISFHP